MNRRGRFFFGSKSRHRGAIAGDIDSNQEINRVQPCLHESPSTPANQDVHRRRETSNQKLHLLRQTTGCQVARLLFDQETTSSSARK